MVTRKELIRRAKGVRLLACDVDGVLTDGAIILLKDGAEVKVWDVKDGLAFAMLRASGRRFRTAWITGRSSPQVAARARDLGVDAVEQDCLAKGGALRRFMRRFRVRPDETLYVGDDIVDLPALRLAGLAVCPSDAHAEVRRACHWVTAAPGGRGAFREAADLVLEAQGLWKGVLDRYDR